MTLSILIVAGPSLSTIVVSIIVLSVIVVSNPPPIGAVDVKDTLKYSIGSSVVSFIFDTVKSIWSVPARIVLVIVSATISPASVVV